MRPAGPESISAKMSLFLGCDPMEIKITNHLSNLKNVHRLGQKRDAFEVLLWDHVRLKATDL